MKQFLRLVLISIIAISCKNDIDRTDYVIDGNAEGMYNGIRVYLSAVDATGRQVNIDTAIVMNETFKMTGQLNHPKLHFISVNGLVGKLPIMIENTEMKLNINKSALGNSQVLGSKSNDLLREYDTTINDLKLKSKTLSTEYRAAQIAKDTLAIKTIEPKLIELGKNMNNLGFDFAKKNNTSFVALQIFTNELRKSNLDLEELKTIFNGFSEDIKNSDEAKIVINRLDFLTKKAEAEKSTAIGEKAPEFSAPNPDGETIALNEVVSKNKITIIDFWAAWCGPCRRENPNILKIYNQYHTKGLEIIGVGLDGRRGQQNPKEAWVKAINDDNLTWYQVSNLKYFDEIAQSYNVNSIPSMFILNNKGEIIAKNLRGKDLENKIAELLN